MSDAKTSEIIKLLGEVFSPDEKKAILTGLESILNKVLDDRLLVSRRLAGDFGESDIKAKALEVEAIRGKSVQFEVNSLVISNNVIITGDNVKVKKIKELNPSETVRLLVLDGNNNIKTLEVLASSILPDFIN